jgi:hypothetical protein
VFPECLNENFVDVKIFPNPAGRDSCIKICINYNPAINLKTSIQIYNIAGDLIYTFKMNEPGTIEWDLTNSSEQKVSSGIYIFNFEIMGSNMLKTFTRKVALIK